MAALNPPSAKYAIASHSHAFAITPGTPFTTPTRGIMVTVAGTVNLTMNDDGSQVTLTLNAGVLYPLSVQAVAAGGTATGIFGFW